MGVARRVVIGMDPHKRSVTVEVMEADERIVGHGRFGTDVAGFAQLVAFAGQWADRISRVMPWEYEYVFDNRVNREAGLPDLTKSFWHDDEIGSLS